MLKKYLTIYLMIFIYAIMSILYAFIPDFFLILFPFVLVCMIYIPLVFRKKTDFFSVWSWIFYSSVFGILLRSIYIFFNIPSLNKINAVFLGGEEKVFLIPAIFLLLSGVFFLVLGYLFTNKKIRFKNKIFINQNWDEKKFFKITIFLSVLSIFSLIVFINLQGGLFSLESISVYRGVSTKLSKVSTHSYLRAVISLSGLNIFLLSTWLTIYKKRKTLARILLFISFITFVFFNFYVSQRAAIVFLFAQIIALSYYLKGFKFPKTKFFFSVILALIFFQVMSTIRSFKSVENENFSFSILKSLEPGILTTNMIDISKTAHIMNAIPGKLNFEYGSTFTTIFIAWIPRGLWPNKPVTNVDNIIAMKVFGAKTYGSGGVPPGIIAELYWNFWIPGVIIGCFLLGVFLKIIDRTIKNYIYNANILIIYVSSFMLIGLSFMGSSFTSVLIGVILNLVPLLIILNIINKKNTQI